MNFRVTTVFFGILLTTLWVFGLMIAQRKIAVDQALIMPTSQSPDVTIKRILFKRFDQDKGTELPAVEFIVNDGRWYLREGRQQTRVLGFRIEEMIKQIKSAKNDETADVPQDPAATGLKQPQAIVTFKGRLKDDDKEWVITIGKDSVKTETAYVTTSDGRDKVYAVPRMSIDSLLLKDANHLRPKHLFNFTDTAVTTIDMKKTGKTSLELNSDAGNLWTFVSPPIGPAEFSDTIEEKKEDPFHGKSATPTRPVTGGVKGLLESVKNVRVEEDDDFVPLGKSHEHYGVDDKAQMRIAIHAGADKKDSEILLVGDLVKDRKKGEVYYFARLAGDDGVMQINARWLAPIETAIAQPGDIRSRNVGAFDPKAVDAVVLKDKDGVEFTFVRSEGDAGWQMFAGGKKHKADTKAMDTLFDQLLGKKAIQKFLDVPADGDLKKKETEWGFDAPAGVITVYVGGIEKAKKDDEKTDEPAKDPKEAIKDKPAKKEEKKDPNAPPTLKKDKAVLTLALGKSDLETVNIRRKLESGAESRFTLKKTFAEKVLPEGGTELAYLDTALPTFSGDDVAALEMFRITDKLTETLKLQRRYAAGKAAWFLEDKDERTGVKLADTNGVTGITNFFATIKVKKWLHPIKTKDDPKYGLQAPVAIAGISVRQPPITAAILVGVLATGDSSAFLTAAAAGVVHRPTAPSETITVKFGKDTDQEKDKPGVFAQHSGADRLFLLPTDLLREFKTIDVYDRGFMMKEHPELIARFVGAAAGDPGGIFLLASPHVRGNVHGFNPDTVTDVRLTVRTPVELRSFTFAKKDKTWVDAGGLQEFQLDGDKVAQLVKDLANLRTDRFASHAGGKRMEHKLGAKDAAAMIDMKLADGRTITVTIGTNYQAHGYFAHSSNWPTTVFFVPIPTIDPLLRGVAHFSKERSGPN